MFQCVPNLSEGRRPHVMEAFRSAMTGLPGVILADLSADPDHNRMVISLLGEGEPLAHAVPLLFRAALHRRGSNRTKSQK